MTEHPASKMLIDLVSVGGGWMRVFNCSICGKRKLGHVGKTLTIKGVWYCNGLSVKNKSQECKV